MKAQSGSRDIALLFL